MVKHGMLTEDSVGDFNPMEKVAYVDEESHYVADEANKDKLKKPVKFKPASSEPVQR